MAKSHELVHLKSFLSALLIVDFFNFVYACFALS